MFYYSSRKANCRTSPHVCCHWFSFCACVSLRVWSEWYGSSFIHLPIPPVFLATFACNCLSLHCVIGGGIWYNYLIFHKGFKSLWIFCCWKKPLFLRKCFLLKGVHQSRQWRTGWSKSSSPGRSAECDSQTAKQGMLEGSSVCSPSLWSLVSPCWDLHFSMHLVCLSDGVCCQIQCGRAFSCVSRLHWSQLLQGRYCVVLIMCLQC